MARIIGLDKIGSLSHAAGILSLGASLLTIGGQQYRVSALSRTIATDITMVANTRYQLFAVVSGGVVSLRISANENSVGPAGFASWKLVGSFYANGLTSVAFGSFVTIEGQPKSDSIEMVVAIVADTTNPTKATSPAYDKGFWERDGDTLLRSYSYSQTAATGGAAGTGAYKARLPAPYSPDPAKYRVAGNTTEGICGKGQFLDGTLHWHGGVRYDDTATKEGFIIEAFRETTGLYGNWSSGNGQFGSAATMRVSMFASIPIIGWSNVAIKDL